MSKRVRELSTAERMRWGKCPVCGAPDGKPCRPEVGYKVGFGGDGTGAHPGRLQNAPMKVMEVPADD